MYFQTCSVFLLNNIVLQVTELARSLSMEHYAVIFADVDTTLCDLPGIARQLL